MAKKSQNDKSASGGWILPLVVGGITGALSSIVLLSWLGDITPNGVSYTDLAAVLLTAVGVLVTVLGVIFAIAAFWGFAELKRSAVNAAEAASIDHVREQIKNGSVRDYLSKAVSEEIESPQTEARINKRVDEIVLGNPEKDDELEEDEVETEG